MQMYHPPPTKFLKKFSYVFLLNFCEQLIYIYSFIYIFIYCNVGVLYVYIKDVAKKIQKKIFKLFE